MTARPMVVYQTRRAGGGNVWVHRARGTWRRITFTSGPSAGSKMLALAGILDRLGAATTTPLRASGVLVSRPAPAPDRTAPSIPRPGPNAAPASPNAP